MIHGTHNAITDLERRIRTVESALIVLSIAAIAGSVAAMVFSSAALAEISVVNGNRNSAAASAAVIDRSMRCVSFR